MFNLHDFLQIFNSSTIMANKKLLKMQKFNTSKKFKVKKKKLKIECFNLNKENEMFEKKLQKGINSNLNSPLYKMSPEFLFLGTIYWQVVIFIC